jgi:hypothetical protein
MKWVAIKDKWGVIHLINLSNVVSVSRLTDNEEPSILINASETKKEGRTAHQTERSLNQLKIIFDTPERRDEVFKRLFEITVATYI